MLVRMSTRENYSGPNIPYGIPRPSAPTAKFKKSRDLSEDRRE